MQGLELLPLLAVMGLIGGVLGKVKGSSFWMWFLISFCIPVLGMITAMFYRYETEELRRQCPTCGRVVKLYDALCTRCGTELEFPDVAIASEGSLRRRTPA